MNKVLDVVERVVWTSIQAGAGALLASGFFDNLGLSFADCLKIAGLAAGASLLKNIVALQIGGDNAQLGVDTYVEKPDAPPSR